MKNDYGTGADKISIPTMLFSLFGDHPDVRMTATSTSSEKANAYLFDAAVRTGGSVASMLSEAGEAAGMAVLSPWRTPWRSAKPTPFPQR